MKATFIRRLQDAWYKEMYISAWFMPLSMLYVDAIRLRRFLYRIGVKKSWRSPVPVIVVGNITVGGTGKTPLVIWLAKYLRTQGYKPGIVSRGYGGKEEQCPILVDSHSQPAQVGDEPVLLARRADCPVVVNANRVAAVQHLLATSDCDLVIADDGLQHYALQRDIEIVVIDGERRFGNGYCLPVGPLREPPERLERVDMVVVNAPQALSDHEFAMQCVGDRLINLKTQADSGLADFDGQQVHALAGIGNPKRFFKQLQAAGLQCICHEFPDHHVFTADDLNFKDSKPVIMTEKDAVKCTDFAQSNYWYLPVTAELPASFSQKLLTLLKDKTHGQKIA